MTGLEPNPRLVGRLYSRDGCGQICTTYNGPEPEWLSDSEPSWDSLRREALSELVDLERTLGLDIPPRNPGLVEDEGGLPAWLLLVVLLAAFAAGLVLVLLLEAVS